MRVDFYQLSRDPAEAVLPQIARNSLKAGERLLVVSGADDQLGKISEHIDVFDFYAWARQALGPVGLLLGWTPIIKGGVNKKANAQLDEFMGR